MHHNRGGERTALVHTAVVAEQCTLPVNRLSNRAQIATVERVAASDMQAQKIVQKRSRPIPPFVQVFCTYLNL